MKFMEGECIMDNQIKGYIINESPSVMTQPEIVSESKCNRVVIKTTLQDADARNRNKRIYPKSVLDKGLHSEYVQERIRTKTFYGEARTPIKTGYSKTTLYGSI